MNYATLLDDGLEAFLHRWQLIKNAKKSIELQTYIYKNDKATQILLYEIADAAKRGVRVRILIDDNGLDKDTSLLHHIQNHENVEVKIFNPYKRRTPLLRMFEIILKFNRINHRMHNKVFIVDDTNLIIGGRNLGDNYFDLNKKENFSDIDLLFVGDVAKEVRENFDLYWNFYKSIDLNSIDTTKRQCPKRPIYSQPNLDFKKLPLHPIKIHLIADIPQKIDGDCSRPILEAMKGILSKTMEQIDISCAYFIPSKEGIKALKQKNVNIVTNSLASTDSIAVYRAWSKYRKKLLKIGAKIYEYKHEKSNRIQLKSRASLHSKAIIFDKKTIWVGSFNLDQRSNNLNTEIVAIIQDENFANLLGEKIKKQIQNSWKVEYKGGKTIWSDQNSKYLMPPNSTLLAKFISLLSSIVPESQL